jgi:SAM-dependent methyltransferase
MTLGWIALRASEPCQNRLQNKRRGLGFERREPLGDEIVHILEGWRVGGSVTPQALMKGFGAYAQTIEQLTLLMRAGAVDDALELRVRAALDGGASAALRQAVSLEDLRNAGAFFTSSSLAAEAVRPLTGSLTRSSIVRDPACGAGDLLLPVARLLLPLWGGDMRKVVTQIKGNDLSPEFVNAARARLSLLMASLVPRSGLELDDVTTLFSGIEQTDALTLSAEVVADATHLVLNPPYTRVALEPGTTWGAGLGSNAAVFVHYLAVRMAPGAELVAIIPEVLRSGSRYERWRREIERFCEVVSVRMWGQFDADTDIDVFILHARRRTVLGTRAASSGRTCWNVSPRPRAVASVGDRFDVSVGAVVPHRDPETGPEVAFADAAALPVGATVRRLEGRRRFSGTTHNPPMVVVRRTSRPGQSPRARATVVVGKRQVAVENHLIVLVPKDGTIETCRQLATYLKSHEATNWLDSNYRCRHLPVSALMDLPWLTTE